LSLCGFGIGQFVALTMDVSHTPSRHLRWQTRLGVMYSSCAGEVGREDLAE
jgi:hypothetical protein